MAFNRAATVARARRVVHKTHGLAATYEDDQVVVPVALTVGLFNRMNLQGDLIEAGYNNVIEGINRVRFNREELDEKNVVPKRAGKVVLTDPLMAGIVLILDHKEPDTGPINIMWGAAAPAP